MTTRVDPVLLEVLKNGFETTADEMALNLMRTAHSPIVRDSMDYSTALCDPAGLTIAQGLTTPMHLGSFYDAMRHLIVEYAGRIAPGDVFIANDPYVAGGQHLPDIYVIKPIFCGGVLCGWGTTIAHHADVGGIVPGSNSIGATEIYQEGLRLPFLKWFDAGRENTMLLDIIGTNVRVPDMVLGDLRAQLAACVVGERGLVASVERYGARDLQRYCDALQDQAETLARHAFSAIADGVYTFIDHIDGLGENPEPIALHLTLTVAGSEITADWAGTAAQVKGGINAPLSFCKSNVYAALRSIMSADVPNCHGYTRPIHVLAPPGTLVNATHPAPCGARGITGYRIVDCIYGALAQALPDRITADGTGGSTLPTFAGRHGNAAFVFSECVMGTWGATSAHDGQEGVPHMASNQSNVPIEMIEADYPIRIERYGFAPDTGGPGEYRGGLGILREYRCLVDDVFLGVRSDKAEHAPHGLFGGGDGQPSSNVINPGPHEGRLPPLPVVPITLRKNDVFRHIMAGGGGYGRALDRDAERVRDDVRDGKVSRDHARAAYGVVLSDDPSATVDVAATRSLRRAMTP
jgi:N-methylhydantoinase B